jgi:hypothetical protein
MTTSVQQSRGQGRVNDSSVPGDIESNSWAAAVHVSRLAPYDITGRFRTRPRRTGWEKPSERGGRHGVTLVPKPRPAGREHNLNPGGLRSIPNEQRSGTRSAFPARFNWVRVRPMPSATEKRQLAERHPTALLPLSEARNFGTHSGCRPLRQSIRPAFCAAQPPSTFSHRFSHSMRTANWSR